MTAPPTTLVVGESVVDLVPDATAVRQPRVGGSPLNVAVGLSSLGWRTTLVTELGQDPYADLVRAHLRRAGVVLEEYVGERTPTASVTLVDGQPSYDLDVPWRIEGHVLPDGLAALHLGSLAALTEPGAANVLALAADAARRGVPVSYDPNLRSPADHTVRPRVTAIAARASVVKLSVEDAGLLDPARTPEEVATGFLNDRTGLVVLTRGDRGAVGFIPTGRVSVPAVPVRVVDTIGAGDAFMAGLLAALRHLVPEDLGEVERAVRAAAEVAALSCSMPGATAPPRDRLRPDWPY